MPEPEEVETTETDEATEVDAVEDIETDEDPTAGLKRALAAERQARRASDRKVRELEQEREAAGKPPEEQAIDAARREGAAEASRAANNRILRTEIRAAAKGRLADPSDAFAYLDLTEFEVGEDGEVDSDAIEEAISELLTKKPYLAVDTGEKFRGGVDQGARRREAKPSQLSKEEIAKLSPEELMQAYKEGRVDTLIGRKP